VDRQKHVRVGFGREDMPEALALPEARLEGSDGIHI
jgi:hypothetical protein